jgi:hypothetical protein
MITTGGKGSSSAELASLAGVRHASIAAPRACMNHCDKHPGRCREFGLAFDGSSLAVGCSVVIFDDGQRAISDKRI